MSQDGGNVIFWNKITGTASYCPKDDITPVLRHPHPDEKGAMDSHPEV